MGLGEVPYMISAVTCEAFDPDLLPEKFNIVALAPKLFSSLREASNFNDDYFYNQLDPVLFLAAAMQNQKFSEGRSGAFFVYSPDKKFIIKTVSSSEYYSLSKLFIKYFKHIQKFPSSLLMRILGAYRVDLFHTTIYITVMENLITIPVNETYDLKGSWVKRVGSIGSSVKKDLDLQQNFIIGYENYSLLLDQLEMDINLLRLHNIVDYSLLVAIQHTDEDFNFRRFEALKQNPSYFLKWQLSTDQRQIYIFGIIDILQDYNLEKRFENWFKTSILCNDKDGISVIPPPQYALRFKKILTSRFE